jgi:hypothetical protein
LSFRAFVRGPGLRGHRAAGAGRKEARRVAPRALAGFLQKSWRALGFAPQLQSGVMERTHAAQAGGYLLRTAFIGRKAKCRPVCAISDGGERPVIAILRFETRRSRGDEPFFA